jgi:hypothetical protein
VALELRDHIGVMTQFELGVEPLLQRLETEFSRRAYLPIARAHR